MTKVVGIPGDGQTGRNQTELVESHDSCKRRLNISGGRSPHNMNSRDDRMDALLANTTGSGKSHIEFDTFVEHDSLEKLHCFYEYESSCKNDSMSEDEPKDLKI